MNTRNGPMIRAVYEECDVLLADGTQRKEKYDKVNHCSEVRVDTD